MSTTIRLKPARHAAPSCEDYADRDTVLRFERAVRVHRAHVEPFNLMRLEDRVDTAYQVKGSSGTPYYADIVDRSAEHDACSCADFLTNELGTCKHLEAVRRALARVPSLTRAFAALPRQPTSPVITLHGAGGLALHSIGRASDRALAELGLMPRRAIGPGRCELQPAPGSAAGLTPGRHANGVRVVHAAAPVLERIVRALRLQRRRAQLEGALADGTLRLDLLSVPLYPYQHEGAAHLLKAGRALLADDMGLGKSAQAIAACEVLRARGEASRILIVTLASLKHQWAREIARFAGAEAVVVGGDPQRRRHALQSDAPYKILNYELTWRELSHLKSLDADVIVYDEAQRAKNFRTKTARTLQQIPSRFAFLLTGTPIENRLDDLYALMQIVEPRTFGPLWRFNLDFHTQSDSGRVVGYKNLSGLRERIAPLVMRRRKQDVLIQLPSLTEQTRYTGLTPVQRELEQGYRAQAAQLAAQAARRGLTKREQELLMMLLIKARQACNAAELCDPKRHGSPKLDEFATLIEEIVAQGTSKVLVFSEWIEMLKLAGRRLDAAGIGHAMLHGGVPTDKRPALLDRFRESDDVRVLLSTEAGGVGLNLQVASYVIHLDLPWNPARQDQRTSRAHRLGQSRGVSAIYLCAESGIERAIEKTLATKRAVRSAALDPNSTIESLEASSFVRFLSEVQEVFEAEESLELSTDGTEVGEREADITAPPAPERSAGTKALAAPSSRDVAAATLPREPAVSAAPALGRGEAYAKNRLALAQLVLDAGFAGDAVKAAYQALAASIAALLPEPASDHAALVAAIYRELVPRGQLPTAAHATLARLHDLSTLDAHGVSVPPALAQSAVHEAVEWVARIPAEPSRAGSDDRPSASSEIGRKLGSNGAGAEASSS